MAALGGTGLYLGVIGTFLAVAILLWGLWSAVLSRLGGQERATTSVMTAEVRWAKIVIYLCIGTALGAVFTTTLQMPLVGVLLVIMGGGFGYFEQKKDQEEALFAFEEELPTLLTRWSNDMASGMAFDRAVENSFADVKPVVRPVLAAIMPQLSEDPVVAFQAAQKRMEQRGVRSESFAMVVAVVSAGSRAGNLGRALHSLSRALQEIENLKYQVKKETEGGRRNVTVMVVAGLLIAVLINVLGPSALQEADPTTQSQMLFAGAIVLLGGAWVAAYYLSRAKV